jgi:hypothetical protein
MGTRLNRVVVVEDSGGRETERYTSLVWSDCLVLSWNVYLVLNRGIYLLLNRIIYPVLN